MKRFSLIAALLVGMSAAAHAETLYVQSQKAKLLKDPSFKAKVVAHVKKGAPLELIHDKGRWYKVSINGNIGWISKFVLAAHPPVKKVTVLGEGVKIEHNARRRASAVTTAGAARGLSADERRRASDFGADFLALERVENFTVSDEEVYRFSKGVK